MKHIMFRFNRRGFNDDGAIYEGEIVGRFVNGVRIRIGEDELNVMYEDITILDDGERR